MEQPFSKSEAQVYEEQMSQMRLAVELGFDAEETGANNLICWKNFGGLPQELVEASMRLFIEEVMPGVRSNVSSPAAATAASATA